MRRDSQSRCLGCVHHMHRRMHQNNTCAKAWASCMSRWMSMLPPVRCIFSLWLRAMTTSAVLIGAWQRWMRLRRCWIAETRSAALHIAIREEWRRMGVKTHAAKECALDWRGTDWSWLTRPSQLSWSALLAIGHWQSFRLRGRKTRFLYFSVTQWCQNKFVTQRYWWNQTRHLAASHVARLIRVRVSTSPTPVLLFSGTRRLAIG